MYDLAKIVWICMSEVVRISHVVKYVFIDFNKNVLFNNNLFIFVIYFCNSNIIYLFKFVNDLGLFHKTSLPNKPGLFQLVWLILNKIIWQQVRLTEINLAYLINFFLFLWNRPPIMIFYIFWKKYLFIYC